MKVKEYMNKWQTWTEINNILNFLLTVYRDS